MIPFIFYAVHSGSLQNACVTFTNILLFTQNIFLGEDIRKQLPRESAEFDDVNANWKVWPFDKYWCSKGGGGGCLILGLNKGVPRMKVTASNNLQYTNHRPPSTKEKC